LTLRSVTTCCWLATRSWLSSACAGGGAASPLALERGLGGLLLGAALRDGALDIRDLRGHLAEPRAHQRPLLLLALQILLAGDHGDLGFVGLGLGFVERLLHACETLSQRARRRFGGGDLSRAARHLRLELADLALLLEDAGGESVAGAAGDAAVAVEHGAVERHQLAVETMSADAARVVGITNQEGVAHQSAHDALVLGGEAHMVDHEPEDALDALPLSERGHLGVMGDHGRSPAAILRQMAEQLERAVEIAHHDAL
jgi:hypothetical protein